MLVTGLGDPEDWPAAVPYRQRGGQSANGVVHLVDDVQSPEAARPRSKNSNQVQNHSLIYSKMMPKLLFCVTQLGLVIRPRESRSNSCGFESRSRSYKYFISVKSLYAHFEAIRLLL